MNDNHDQDRQRENGTMAMSWLAPHIVWSLKSCYVTRNIVVEHDGLFWVDLQLLDRVMSSVDHIDDMLPVTVLFDGCLKHDRIRGRRYIPFNEVDWVNICCDVMIDPALHGYVESAAFFGPLSSVMVPITKQITKHGITQRCQKRNSKDMAARTIVTREIGSMNLYQGYVLRVYKQWLLCALLGNYNHTKHNNRPHQREVRQRLYAIFTEPQYERWVVKLIHQCIDMSTLSIRSFICFSIRYNPALKQHVEHLIQLPEYERLTEQALDQVRWYFTRYLMQSSSWHIYNNGHDQSDLWRSFHSLPSIPCYLQHYYVCGDSSCTLPCPHKFMKSKEIKHPVADDEEEIDELSAAIEKELVMESSIDWKIIAQNRKEEVERENTDTQHEFKSGWSWKPDQFHHALNRILSAMESQASKLSYSRPWKLNVLFRTNKQKAGLLDPPPSHEQLTALHEIVQYCGPVRQGNAMLRIVSFFPYLGVSRELSGNLQDLLHQRKMTENTLKHIIKMLAEHEPHAYNLLLQSWMLVRAANQHYFMTTLPLHITRCQLEVMNDVYHHRDRAILAETICFVFCDQCDQIYSHLMDPNTMYSKVFRFGLRNASSHPLTGASTCTKPACQNKVLVHLPLAGRLLHYKHKRIMICPQWRCGRFMVLDDHERSDSLWNDRGPACLNCTVELAPNVRSYVALDSHFGKEGLAHNCSLRSFHPHEESSKRVKLTDLHMMGYDVYVCRKHYRSKWMIELTQHIIQQYKTPQDIRQHLIESIETRLGKELRAEECLKSERKKEKSKRFIKRHATGFQY